MQDDISGKAFVAMFNLEARSIGIDPVEWYAVSLDTEGDTPMFNYLKLNRYLEIAEQFGDLLTREMIEEA